MHFLRNVSQSKSHRVCLCFNHIIIYLFKPYFTNSKVPLILIELYSICTTLFSCLQIRVSVRVTSGIIPAYQDHFPTHTANITKSHQKNVPMWHSQAVVWPNWAFQLNVCLFFDSVALKEVLEIVWAISCLVKRAVFCKSLISEITKSFLCLLLLLTGSSLMRTGCIYVSCYIQ